MGTIKRGPQSPIISSNSGYDNSEGLTWFDGDYEALHTGCVQEYDHTQPPEAFQPDPPEPLLAAPSVYHQASQYALRDSGLQQDASSFEQHSYSAPTNGIPNYETPVYSSSGHDESTPGIYNADKPFISDPFTIRSVPNFVEPSPETSAIIAGHPSAVTDLALMISGWQAKAQKLDVSGPYASYAALHAALLQMYQELGIECPSLQEICRIHRSAEWIPYAAQVASENGWNKPYSLKSLDLESMAGIIRLLAIKDSKILKHDAVYQLGVVTIDDSIHYARTYPQSPDIPTGTAWLYHDCKDWYGICSVEALGHRPLTQQNTFQPPTLYATPHQNDTQPPVLLETQSTNGKRRRTDRTCGTANSRSRVEVGDNYDVEDDGGMPRKQPRKTARTVEATRIEYPSHYSPTQIMNEPGDVHHYNNLLRVALWYGNKEIFEQLNDGRRKQGLDPHKSLSAITKRVGTACKHIADAHGIPVKVFRHAFNVKRAQNDIGIHDEADVATVNMVMQYQPQIDAALEKIVSASPHDGLVVRRDVHQYSPTAGNSLAIPLDDVDGGITGTKPESMRLPSTFLVTRSQPHPQYENVVDSSVPHTRLNHFEYPQAHDNAANIWDMYKTPSSTHNPNIADPDPLTHRPEINNTNNTNNPYFFDPVGYDFDFDLFNDFTYGNDSPDQSFFDDTDFLNEDWYGDEGDMPET